MTSEQLFQEAVQASRTGRFHESDDLLEAGLLTAVLDEGEKGAAVYHPPSAWNLWQGHISVRLGGLSWIFDSGHARFGELRTRAREWADVLMETIGKNPESAGDIARALKGL